jgi:hypothetical protein
MTDVTTTTDDELDEVDKAALESAMQIARREPGRSEQLDAKLETESWFDVAWFAAGCVQGRALHLRPWEESPCHVDEDDPQERDKQAQALLRRMLAAGVSRYHPDPLRALEEADQK